LLLCALVVVWMAQQSQVRQVVIVRVSDVVDFEAFGRLAVGFVDEPAAGLVPLAYGITSRRPVDRKRVAAEAALCLDARPRVLLYAPRHGRPPGGRTRGCLRRCGS